MKIASSAPIIVVSKDDQQNTIPAIVLIQLMPYCIYFLISEIRSTFAYGRYLVQINHIPMSVIRSKIIVCHNSLSQQQCQVQIQTPVQVLVIISQVYKKQEFIFSFPGPKIKDFTRPYLIIKFLIHSKLQYFKCLPNLK